MMYLVVINLLNGWKVSGQIVSDLMTKPEAERKAAAVRQALPEADVDVWSACDWDRLH